jgi:hypothetical protein
MPRLCTSVAGLLLLAASCSSAHAGYTHYWKWREPPSNDVVTQCVADMNRLIEARKSILVSPDEEGAKPGILKLEASKVDFNGFGDHACEPFAFPFVLREKQDFNFCKTLGEPYDEVVTACLIVARDHFPPSVLEISSDGSWQDWTAGATLYATVFARPAKNPMYPSSAGNFGFWLLLSIVLLIVAGLIAARKFGGHNS